MSPPTLEITINHLLEELSASLDHQLINRNPYQEVKSILSICLVECTSLVSCGSEVGRTGVGWPHIQREVEIRERKKGYWEVVE